MTSRHLFALPMLVITLAVLTSCHDAAKHSAAPSASPPVAGNTLYFRITWADYSGRGEAIQKIINRYNEEHSDGCTIEMIGGDEDSAAIQDLLDSGKEMIYVLPYRYVQYYGDKGALTDLTTDFSDAEDLFYPEIWELGTVDGTVYGIPWLGHSMCLLYNKNLLAEAGVHAVSLTSLDALVTALDKVEENTDAYGIGLVGAAGNDVSWMVNQFIYGFGGSLVNEDGTAVTINSSHSKAALDFYKDTLGKYAQPTWTDDNGENVMDYFRKQEAAFEIQGIWGVTDIEKNGSPFEVGILSMGDVGLRSEVGPMMLAIPASMSDEYRKEAVTFINHMISPEAQEDILQGEYSPEHDTYYPFRTPIRVDMADCRILQSNPEYLVFMEGFQNPSIDVPMPEWEEIKDKFYETGLHQVMTGEITAEELLKEIETEGNKILETN